VTYGRGLPATAVAVAPKEVINILKSEHGQNTVIKFVADGKSESTVMIREYSYHPLTRKLEHVDFVQVQLDEPVDVEVPFFAVGKAVGLTQGGMLRQVYRTLPVRCLPGRIPAKIEVDISHLALGEHTSTKDLTLPEGVAVLYAPERTLVAIVAPEKDRTEEAAVVAGAADPKAAAADPKAAAAKPGAAKADTKDAKKK
jgi:large subunit ribosomal protein L25